MSHFDLLYYMEIIKLQFLKYSMKYFNVFTILE